MLLPGAPRENQVDGLNGIDNAWGASLLPIIQRGLVSELPSADATNILASGKWTLLIQATGLSDDISQSAVGLDAQVFIGAPLTSAPTFDSSTDWPILASSTNGNAALVHFATAYVVNGLVVARDASSPLVIPLQLMVHDQDSGAPVRSTLVMLRLHDAVITFARDSPDSASVGTIAGILEQEDVVSTATSILGDLATSLCGSAHDGIMQQILQSEDILHDGRNASDQSCDAFSIGLGFTAKRIANPTTVVPDPPPPRDPCALDAGLD